MSGFFNPFLIQSAIQAMTPILLAALAGVLCARVGIFNMALEGQMLIGCFFAVVGSYFSGSALGGVGAAMLATTLFTLPLAFGATKLRGDAVPICIAMNLLASGLTSYLLPVIFGVSGTFSDPRVVALGKIRPLWLHQIPVLGTLVWGQTAVTYLSWGLVAVVAFLLFRMPVGLRLRGVGEQPDAAETLGISVHRYRIATVLLSSTLLGLSGAQLSLGTVSVFSENMSSGRGWIALVAVMLGRTHPAYAGLACVLFGFADAVSLRLQAKGLPNQLTDIAPYVVTLVALAISYQKRPRRKGDTAIDLAASTAADDILLETTTDTRL
ncbi:MAG: ABC transporter permease [Rhizobium sp.]